MLSPALTHAASTDMPRARFSIQGWDATSGLPQDAVVALAQTRDGFLWVATGNGLARFDGVQFEVFNHANTPQLSTSYVDALAASPDGSLWIGSAGGGVSQWKDGRFHTYTTKDGLSSDQIAAITVDADGRVWAGTSRGLDLLSGQRWSSVGQAEGWKGSVNYLTSTPQGVWACGTKSVMHWQSGKLRILHAPRDLPDESFVTIHPAGPSSVWLAAESGKLYLLDADRAVEKPVASWKGNRGIQSFVTDATGRLWMGSFGGGLAEWRDDGPHVLGEPDGWSARTVYSLLADREGNLWVGTISGLYRIRTNKFADLTKADGLKGNLVRAIYEDPDGTLWVGTDTAMHRYRDGHLEALPDSSPQGHAFLTAAQTPLGLLFGTVRSGIVRATPRGYETFAPLAAAQTKFIPAILQAGDNRLWVAVNGVGIQVVDHDSVVATFGVKDGLPSTGVRSLLQAADGSYWAGAFGGIGHFKDSRWTSFTTKDGLPSNLVMTLHEDASHRLWAGTVDGLAYFSGNRFVALGSRQGFPASSVFSILEDESHDFWLGTGAGVVHVTRNDLDAAIRDAAFRVNSVTYGREAGMPATQCSGGTMGVAARLRNGDLLFGTSDGVVWIRPSLLKKKQTVPTPLVKELIIDGQPSTSANPVIPPGTRTTEFHYTSPSLSVPDKVSFRYQLENFDSDWIDAGSRRVAFYTNLPAGNYRFRVMARNEDGLWSANLAQIPVIAQPHFWSTWWFIALVVIALIALLRWAHLRRLARIEQRHAAVIEERTRIAREIHDTYLQGFTGVTLQVDALRSQLAGHDPTLRERFDKILKQADASLLDARRSVWDLRSWDPEKTTLAAFLQTAARDAAEGSTITVSCRMDDSGWHTLSPHDCDSLRRIVQEAVTNAVRHAGCQNVTICLRGNPRQGELTIADDGQGFVCDAVQGRHFGLKNMDERAAHMGGQLAVDSAPGRGTTVRLQWRRPHSWLPLGEA